MEIAIYLIPAGMIFGLVILRALIWSIKSGQYDDLEGAANRILYDDESHEAEERNDK
ncbi:MAG: ccoS [Candidatus Midichloriaceae bacterium]|jgi:cbb3-type cytochrome oxidase maturation protein|nr:ccoS [Candidatus Midichloriaceae bacterium]